VLLARALYRQPKIPVLNKGTANLDQHNEALFADLVAAMPITRIVVAHHPALIARAHKVYVVGARKLTLAELRRAPPDALAAPAEPARLLAAKGAGEATAR
jgi:ATP-binding cassette, subfamily B, bacterial CvaB/MchF/RaxB